MKKAMLVLAAVLTFCLVRSSQCQAAAYAYVANRGDNTVSVIRVSDNTITQLRVDDPLLGSLFMGVSIAPDGDHVYLANAKANAVYVIDTSRVTDIPEEALVATVPVGKKPIGVAVSPDGDYVYVANRGDGTVSVIKKIPTTPPSWEEVTDQDTRISVGSAPIGVAVSPSPEGDYVYVTNRDGHLDDDTDDGTLSVIQASLIDTPDEAVVATVPIGKKPIGVAVSPDGDYVYVANRGDGTVSVIKKIPTTPPSWEEVTDQDTRISVGSAPIGVAVSPDGVHLYVTNMNSNTVYAINAARAIDDPYNAVVDSVSVGERPVGVAMTPNGDYVYVTNQGADTGDAIEEDTEDDSANGTVSVIRTSDYSVTSIDMTDENGPASFGQFIASISPPEVPTGLDATVESNDQIDLSWQDNSSDESGFKIERKEGSKQTYTEIATVGPNVTSYSDSGLEPRSDYSYRVRAYNKHGDSNYSDEIEATSIKAPTDFRATDTSHSRIRLSWKDNSYGESGVEIERMQVSENNDSGTDDDDSEETSSATAITGSFTKIDEVGANVTSYSDGDLEPYTTYRYRVRAVTADDESGWSNEAETRTDDDCFIATAAYGSLMEPHVVTLRHFRDAYLLPHTLGRVFVRTYYATSPPIANYVSRHETLRAVIRASLLPLVAFSYSMLHLGLTLTLTILVFIALSPLGLHWLCQREKTSHKTAV
jgi:YVTN family beta-propeller protein